MRTNDAGPDSVSGRRSPMKRALAAAWKLVLLALIVWFWRGYIIAHWAELSAIDILPHWPSVAGAAAVYAAGYVLLGCLWKPFLREFNGTRLSFPSAFRASAISWAGRYVPGKVLTAAAKTVLSAPDRSRMASTGVAVVIEVLWSQLSCVCAAVVLASVSGAVPEIAAFRVPALCVLVLVLAGMHPRVFMFVSGAVLSVLGRPALARAPSFAVLLGLFLGHIVVFFLFTAGFVMLLDAVRPVDWTRFAEFSALFCFAWSAGFWSLLAPAGIGVRDSILAYGLGHMMGFDATAVVAAVVGSRVLMTAVEAVCFAVAVFMPGVSAFGAFSGSRGGADARR